MKDKYIIFDLDDTLMYEIDFLKSAYREIIGIYKESDLYNKMLERYFKGENAFDLIAEKYDVTIPQLLVIYREHKPKINLIDGANFLLNYCQSKKYKIGLISDGYSITQRNKLKALKIEDKFNKIIISEEFGSSKPSLSNFEIFMNKNSYKYYYIADNTQKDFVTPNKLSWTTICLLDKGKNIHKQRFDLEENYLPKYRINSLLDAIEIIER